MFLRNLPIIHVLPYFDQQNLALEKSISGCASMNAFSFSCFSRSSLVGFPWAFAA